MERWAEMFQKNATNLQSSIFQMVDGFWLFVTAPKLHLISHQ